MRKYVRRLEIFMQKVNGSTENRILRSLILLLNVTTTNYSTD